jgi:alginate O-acetyltransferase complex protein AlgI
MLFNSFVFWLFFAVVWLFYFFLDHKGKNRWLLLASYIFYGAWDWRFLLLLLFSTVVDYFCALKISETGHAKTKKKFVLLSLCVNMGVLGFFKYFNFFSDSVGSFLGLFNIHPDFITLNVILPVGISFYTFQTLSYTLDVYRNKIKPSKDFLDFALYVSFFPQLVAGPIERAEKLMPQIQQPRTLNKGHYTSGIKLIIVGLFKKVVIADNLAYVVNYIFRDYLNLDAPMYLLGAYAFAFQIYGDFSGYTDIARGVAKLLGFDLMVNFRSPYLAKNPSDFWKRWHISLSTWLKDYLYIPLGGNRKGSWMTVRNLMLTMVLGGLWHGASWMFVLWGFYHGLLLVGYHAFERLLAKRPATSSSSPFNVLNIFVMFHLTCIGWIFFRAQSWQQAMTFLSGLVHGFMAAPLRVLALCCVVLIAMQIVGSLWNRAKVYYQNINIIQSISLNTSYYLLLCFLIFLLGDAKAQQFIYFQF